MAENAYLNGLRLDCETLSTGFEKSVAVHEFPFANHALVRDLGQKARSVTLRCYFLNARYPEHKALLALLDKPGPLELEHPDYGLLSGAVKRVAVRRDDREETAEVDLEFVAGAAEVKAEAVADVESELGSRYARGLDQAKETFASAVVEALGEDAAPVLEASVSPDEAVLGQFSGISATARALVRKVDAVVRTLEAEIADVATPANALISTIRFTEDLPGRVIGAMARTAHRYSVLLDSLSNAPDRFLGNLKINLEGLEQALYPDGVDDGSQTRGPLLAVCALEASLMAGALFAADETARQAREALENEPAFDALGNYLDLEEADPVMNAREIENALYAVRVIAAAAVAENRSQGALKTAVATLTAHVSRVKLRLEQLVSVTVAGPVPLHLVCLQRGLPYRAAERILDVNEIENPNFVSGALDVYAS